MNVADSEAMLKSLHQSNFQTTDNPDDADLVVLNTCHIREKARHKVMSRIGILERIKRRRPDMQIAVTGCVAQAEGRRLINDCSTIDVLVGPGKIDQLESLLKENKATKKPAVAIGFKRDHEHKPVDHSDHSVAPTTTGKNEITRYVNIIQGCNNYCTFCVVPFTRGREISRTPEEIIHETANLVRAGAKEITLLGQNVNSYGMDLAEKNLLTSTPSGPFVDLLKMVAAIPGLDRLRFTTSNPHDFTYDLANLFATEPKLGKYLHLPVQCGNDIVLENMKRKVTVEEYMAKIRWIRDIDSEMALSTDLIVGFPGETDEQFEDTLKLMEMVRYSFVFAFKYSPRPNTPAARLQNQVPEHIKDQRLLKLNNLQDSITDQLNRAEIGRERDVLFTYESKKNPGTFYGRTPHFRLVRVSSDRDIVGQTLPVKITGGNKTSLEGHRV
jgi:tRNA-2-methylthio-N6-dimethylallyladenosine synthase